MSCLLGCLKKPATGGAWQPNGTDLPSLYGWYDLSLSSTIFKDDGVTLAANGEDIYRVNSRVGDRPIKQTGSNKPTRRTAVQNGLSVAEFAGTDFMGYTGAAGGFSNFTGIIVLKTIASTGDDYFYWCGTTDLTGAGRSLGRAVSVHPRLFSNAYAAYAISSQSYDVGGSFHLAGNTFASGSNASKFFYDGNQENLTLNGNAAAAYGNVGIGGYSTLYHHTNMYCCEAIFFTSVLADADIRKVEGYLAHKWGLAGNLPVNHPYKSAEP